MPHGLCSSLFDRGDLDDKYTNRPTARVVGKSGLSNMLMDRLGD